MNKVYRCRKESRKPKIEDNIIKDVGNLFRLKKENYAINDRVIKGIKNLSELEEGYCKAVTVGNCYSNNYI